MSPPSALLDLLRGASRSILLPLDLARCPVEAFDLANLNAACSGAEVTLLYVQDPAADPELARARLEYVGRRFLERRVRWRPRVRAGAVAGEILAEAREAAVGLLVLPTLPSPWWRRLAGGRCGRVVREIARSVDCELVICEGRYGVDFMAGARTRTARGLSG
jgi:hypothetical protein